VKKIVSLDIEATGTDPLKDRIVELAMLVNGTKVVDVRINPQMPIPLEAQEVHGITDEDVKDCATFGFYANMVQDVLEDAIILGYSSRTYDTVMLDAELRRFNCSGIDLNTVKEIDLYRVWAEAEPRTLVNAVSRFVGRELEGAHGAMADAEVLYELMAGMGVDFGLDPEKMIELSKPSWEADRSGKLRLNDDGEVCWNFGMSRGGRCKDEVGLIHWVLDRDFPPDTKAILRGVLEEMAEERIAKRKDIPF